MLGNVRGRFTNYLQPKVKAMNNLKGYKPSMFILKRRNTDIIA